MNNNQITSDDENTDSDTNSKSNTNTENNNENNCDIDDDTSGDDDIYIPTDDDLQDYAQNTWNCELCTYSNNNISIKCKICNKPKEMSCDKYLYNNKPSKRLRCNNYKGNEEPVKEIHSKC